MSTKIPIHHHSPYAFQLQHELNDAGIICAVWATADQNFVEIWDKNANNIALAQKIIAAHQPNPPKLPASPLAKYNGTNIRQLDALELAVLLNQLSLQRLDLRDYLTTIGTLEKLP